MRTAVLPLCAIIAQSVQFEYRAHEASLQQHDFQLTNIMSSMQEPPQRKEISNSSYPRRAFVNLDLPPRERWFEVISKYRFEIIPYFHYWQWILNRHKEIDQIAWATAIWNKLKPDHRRELEGIMETLHDNAITWTNLLLFQAMYEVGSPMLCSEVLAAGPDGSVIHGRDLDYREVSPLIEITFTKRNEPFIISPVYLAGIGLHTAIKPKHWSFGQNTRKVSNDTVASALKMLQGDGVIFATFVRDTMEEDLSFNQVVDKLVTVPLLKDMYFNIGGSGYYEGTVIARAADPNFVHVNDLSPTEPKRWFLFQTNDDLGQPSVDSRRGVGIQAMKKLTQANVNPMGVLKVMMTPPVYALSNVVLFMMAPRSGQSCSVLGPMITNDEKLLVDPVQCAMYGWNASQTESNSWNAESGQSTWPHST